MPHSTPVYYTLVTAEKRLTATPDEYRALEAALDTGNDEEFSRFSVEYDNDGKIFVFADDFGVDWSLLSHRFLVLLGNLIARNGLKYLKFHVAFECDEPVENIQAETYFRIRGNGKLSEPNLYWQAKRRYERRRQNTVPKADKADQPTVSQQTEITKQGSREA
jgi:hypothetical protein